MSHVPIDRTGRRAIRAAAGARATGGRPSLWGTWWRLVGGLTLLMLALLGRAASGTVAGSLDASATAQLERVLQTLVSVLLPVGAGAARFAIATGDVSALRAQLRRLVGRDGLVERVGTLISARLHRPEARSVHVASLSVPSTSETRRHRAGSPHHPPAPVTFRPAPAPERANVRLAPPVARAAARRQTRTDRLVDERIGRSLGLARRCASPVAPGSRRSKPLRRSSRRGAWGRGPPARAFTQPIRSAAYSATRSGAPGLRLGRASGPLTPGHPADGAGEGDDMAVTTFAATDWSAVSTTNRLSPRTNAYSFGPLSP
jgi:hypothetical protein